MSEIVNIEKLGEVKEASMLTEAAAKDQFTGILLQTNELPADFYYGNRRTLIHTCVNCGKEVTVKWEYGSENLVGLSYLSRQDFNENRGQLDVVGLLFDQYLTHEIDINGFESYMYTTSPIYNRGALLKVSYYYCMHCQAQYLAAYRIHVEDDRPPFNPDEMLFNKILHVRFDAQELLKILKQPDPRLAS